MTMVSEEIGARGMTFTVRRAGTAGEPIMLLHGFPESSAMWGGMMMALAADGYRCAAPDQRGYSLGARPAATEAYRHEELVADVFALADALGWERFHLVAHDWGAAIAWLCAIDTPDRLLSLTVLSIPHYHAFAEASWSDPEVEGYRKFLNLVLAPDGAAERVFGRDDMAGFRSEWTHHDPAEVAETLALLRQPAALTGALAWYRASDAHRRILSRPADPVEVPTLLLTGRHDPYARAAAIALGERIATAGYRRLDLDAGHWLVQERPRDVLAAVRGHLRANSPATATTEETR